MRTTASERAALAIASVVLVLSAMFLFVGFPSSDNESALASATPSAAATVAPSVARQATARPVAATKAPIVTVAPRATVGASGSVRPGPAHAPRAGAYRYRETDSNGTRASTVRITDQGSGKQTETQDGGIVDEVQWRANGKYDLATTFKGGPYGDLRCDWIPDYVQYRLPLGPGVAWSFDSSCHPNASTTIRVAGSSHVKDAERDTVGGKQVDTWVVLADVTITFKTAQGTLTEKLHDEDHFLPDRGVTVHEVTMTVDTAPSGQRSKDTTTRDLTSLDPS